MLEISTIKGLILDMDGVIWRGSKPIRELPKIFNRLAPRGWKVVLATNNATQTASQYVDRLNHFGVSVESHQIINSAMVAAEYLSEMYPKGGPVYVIGETGLIEPLEKLGFNQSDEQVLAVIVGMDRHLTYDKLRKATLLIRGGAAFIATNSDRTFPAPDGLIPGAGAILAALETACYQSPKVVGKPSAAMYQMALKRLSLEPSDILVVGDRPETDIAGAQAIGCHTALVLSGVASLKEAHAWQPAPDLIIADLESISKL